MPGEGEAQMPGRPTGPPPSPESHEDTDSMGGLAKSHVPEPEPQQKPLFIYLFSSHTQISSRLCARNFTHTEGRRRCHGAPTLEPDSRPRGASVSPDAHFHI